jgi:hypothetical protein
VLICFTRSIFYCRLLDILPSMTCASPTLQMISSEISTYGYPASQISNRHNPWYHNIHIPNSFPLSCIPFHLYFHPFPHFLPIRLPYSYSSFFTLTQATTSTCLVLGTSKLLRRLAYGLIPVQTLHLPSPLVSLPKLISQSLNWLTYSWFGTRNL